ncbi:hypothetical protein Tco_1047716 [Tanacetum coccineum]
MLLSTEIEDLSSNILTRLVELTFSSPIPLYLPTLKDLLSIKPTVGKPRVETLARVLDGFQIDLSKLTTKRRRPRKNPRFDIRRRRHFNDVTIDGLCKKSSTIYGSGWGPIRIK